jgi:sigma-B regulation protein RsbU (phosphoserine phosphatase)
VRESGLLLIRFNDTGQVTGSFPESTPNTWLFKQLVQALAEKDADKRDALKKKLAKPMVETFGKGKTLSFFLNQKGGAFRVRYRGNPGWVCWNLKKREGFVLLLPRLIPFAQRFALAARKTRLSGLAEVTAGWLSADSVHVAKRSAAPALRLAESEIAGLRKQAAGAGQTVIASENFLIQFRPAEDGMTLFAHFPNRKTTVDEWHCRFRMATGVGGGLLLLLSGLFARISFRIQTVTVGLFLLAGVIPIGGIFLGSVLFIDGYYDRMSALVQKEELETLKNFDRRYSRFLDRVSTQLAGVMARLISCKTPTDFAREGRVLRQPGLAGRLKIINTYGETVYCSMREMEGFDSTIDLLAHMVLKHRVPEKYRLIPENRKSAVYDSMADYDLSMEFIPKFLYLVVSREARNYLYWDFFPHPHTTISYASMILRSKTLISHYVRKAIQDRIAVFQQGIGIGVFDLDTGTWVQRGFSQAQKLTPLLLQAAGMNRPRTGRIRIGAEIYWYATFPGQQLFQKVLVAAFPDRVLRRELDRLKMLIGVGVVLTLGVALFLGRLVSHRLISPIRELGEGLKAIREERYDDFIPDERGDEMGEVARAFNQMMQEREETRVAAIVQENLLPRDFPDLPGYSCFGRTRFANDLGGDTLDARLLGDGRLFFQIGDVSGHGVASALIMAFVKSLVTIWTGREKQSLDELALEIGRCLQSSGKHKTFYAAVMGIMEPATGEVKLLTLGHPYPLVRRANGTVEYFGRAFYPLGRTKMNPGSLIPLTFTLEPGDGLFCFTDGCVESLTRDGSPFGYPALENWFSRRPLSGHAARDILLAFEQDHLQQCPEPDDDVTLFLLNRSPKSVATA